MVDYGENGKNCGGISNSVCVYTYTYIERESIKDPSRRYNISKKYRAYIKKKSFSQYRDEIRGYQILFFVIQRHETISLINKYVIKTTLDSNI